MIQLRYRGVEVLAGMGAEVFDAFTIPRHQ